jgi:hypothetical protein
VCHLDRVVTSDEQVEVRLSDELQHWIEHEHEPTLGSLIDVFGKRAFAIVFVMLLGVPALPLPTGGATHLFEIIAVLLALQLVLGRDEMAPPAMAPREAGHRGALRSRPAQGDLQRWSACGDRARHSPSAAA